MQITSDQIDALLPQTQCQLCTYSGCRPYADAIVNKGDAINRCLPGGVTTLIKLAELTAQNPEPFVAEMQQKQKAPSVAIIREDECIGCTKCIQACPVDAIIGAGKQMHTVVADECTGCELCIAPCPVDCIDMIAITELADNEKLLKANQFRHRFETRNARLKDKAIIDSTKQSLNNLHKTKIAPVATRQTEIQAALARVKLKKLAKSNE